MEDAGSDRIPRLDWLRWPLPGQTPPDLSHAHLVCHWLDGRHFLPSYSHSSPPLLSPMLNLSSSIAYISITKLIKSIVKRPVTRCATVQTWETECLAYPTRMRITEERRKREKREKKTNAALFPRRRRRQFCWTPMCEDFNRTLRPILLPWNKTQKKRNNNNMKWSIRFGHSGLNRLLKRVLNSATGKRTGVVQSM